MKATIDSIVFDKKVSTKYGEMCRFIVNYNGKKGTFLAKEREQSKFKAGAENEFTETERKYDGIVYYNIAAIKSGGSNYSRNVKKEQSKYSGFAMSYSKDLVVAGKIEYEQLYIEAKGMLDWMVEQDKLLANG